MLNYSVAELRYIEKMWRYKAFLHLSQVMSIDGKPASPHHSFERELKGLSCQGLRDGHFTLIDGYANIRVLSGEPGQLRLLQ